MDPRFSLDSATACAQEMVELSRVTRSGGLVILGSVAFQRRIFVAVVRGGVNFVVYDLTAIMPVGDGSEGRRASVVSVQFVIEFNG